MRIAAVIGPAAITLVVACGPARAPAADAAIDVAIDAPIVPAPEDVILPLPAALPCAQAIGVDGYAAGTPFGTTTRYHVELLDEHERLLARAPADAERHPAVIELAALAVLRFSDDPPAPELHFRLPCDEYDSRGASWRCDHQACELESVVRPGPIDVPEIDTQIAPRCSAAARGVAPIGRCRAAITAEAHRLLAELATTLAIACRDDACTDPWLALRDWVDAFARARGFRHVRTTVDPPLAYGTDDDPSLPLAGRSTFTAGARELTLECLIDHETDGHPLECHLVLAAPGGPARFVRDVTHHVADVRYRDGVAEVDHGESTLAGDALALRATR